MSYTAWPTHTDVSVKLASIGVTLPTAYNSAAVTLQLDSAIETVNRVTKRTWIAETADRYYSGNNTGRLEIDEYLTVNTVYLVSYLGLPSPTIEIDGINEVEEVGTPKTLIEIFSGSLPGYTRHYINRFVTGRSNIKVNAVWGYAETIPYDLWYAVLVRAGAKILKENAFNGIDAGYLIKWQEAGIQEVSQFQDPEKFLGANGGSSGSWSAILKRYKKPSNFTFRRMTKEIV